MITRTELTEIGSITKTHGINGELNVIIPVDVDLESLSCAVIDIDGIFVPFFMTGVRQKGADGYLIKLDGVTTEEEAVEFRGKTLYALSREVESEEGGDADNGLYADDLIGYKACSLDGLLQGEIIDLDTSTENILFIIERPEGNTCLVPVVDEFISDIDSDNKIVTFDLPDGLID
ncbi:MAG: 16S rRNA processing protein RimM [Bacteroidales bacterium]|nr:16S rRNA processing protein RimM [Bacteroidales bacterium]